MKKYQYVISHLAVVLLSIGGTWMILATNPDYWVAALICVVTGVLNVWLAWTAWREARAKDAQ